jgi:DNA-binding PadR family transcriptional regulator
MATQTLLTPLGIAALALLAERPMHPYEMYQLLIQRSEDRIVKVRPGSLYHSVDRLARAGLLRATGTEREGNRPERTTYEITEAGQLALGERISEMLGTPTNEYPEFPLAIGEAHNLPRATVIQLLRSRLNLLGADLAFTEGGLRDLKERGIERRFWLNVEYTKALIEVEIEWLLQLIDDLETGALRWLDDDNPSDPSNPSTN